MPLDPLHAIAERKIQAAIESGAFRDLPGAGKPLALDDLSGVPEELRASYLVLKRAGFLPEEMELKRELLRLEHLIAACADTAELAALRRRRTSAALRFSILMERRGFAPALAEYSAELAARLGG
jgi:hypothetical protein